MRTHTGTSLLWLIVAAALVAFGVAAAQARSLSAGPPRTRTVVTLNPDGTVSAHTDRMRRGDASCAQAGIRLFDGDDKIGNEICFFGAGNVDLSHYCRVWKANADGEWQCGATWAGGVQSYQATVHGSFLEASAPYCTELFMPREELLATGSCARHAPRLWLDVDLQSAEVASY